MTSLHIRDKFIIHSGFELDTPFYVLRYVQGFMIVVNWSPCWFSFEYVSFESELKKCWNMCWKQIRIISKHLQALSISASYIRVSFVPVNIVKCQASESWVPASCWGRPLTTIMTIIDGGLRIECFSNFDMTLLWTNRLLVPYWMRINLHA